MAFVTCAAYTGPERGQPLGRKKKGVPVGLSFSAALAFAVTVVLTLTLRPLALRLRITDKPGGRKQHIGEIPLVGGIAMFIGLLVAAMAAMQPMGRWTLLVPAALLVIVGVIDDRTMSGCRHGWRHSSAPRSS